MSSAPHQLSVEQVHVWRGDLHVLKGLTLRVSRGELLHVTGPNGAGKTTLLRVMTGLTRPEQGEVTWRARNIHRFRNEFHGELAYLSHEPALKGDLTALENLRFSVALRRRVDSAELREALARTGAAGFADLPARVLSAGQRRRVAVARVLACRASVWLLDEPFTNLDVQGGDLVTQLLTSHVRAGGLAVVAAHQELRADCPIRRLEMNA